MNNVNTYIQGSIFPYLTVSDQISARGTCRLWRTKIDTQAVILAKATFINLNTSLTVDLDAPMVALRLLSFRRIATEDMCSFLFEKQLSILMGRNSVAIYVTAKSQCFMTCTYHVDKGLGLYRNVTIFTNRLFDSYLVGCEETEENNIKTVQPNQLEPTADHGPLKRAEEGLLSLVEQRLKVNNSK